MLKMRFWKVAMSCTFDSGAEMSSVGSEAGSEENHPSRNGDVIKTGCMKKLKTMKKKFFLLRAGSSNFPASLEYYDSGKKWKNKHPPKRSIVLRECFSINRREDTKHKYVIALFTGIESFGIVFESEDDCQDWFRLLLAYHHEGEDVPDGISLKPYYEHVWKVTIQKKELACKHNMSGIYLICLTDSTVSLVKPAVEEDQEWKIHELTLQSIRRYGALDMLFYMELGQASCFGSGNFWMQADDTNIAQHMYSVIREACKNCPKKDYLPTKCRSRSSSANEASKPAKFGRNKWPSSGDDNLNFLSYSKSHSHQEHSITSPNCTGHSVSSMGDGIHHNNPNLTTTSFSPYPPTRRASTGTRPVITGPALLSSGRTNTSYTGRERCDSLPTRPRMTLDALSCVKNANMAFYSGGRPCSMYNRAMFSHCGSSHPTSPTSATYSTDSAGSSLSVDVDHETWSEMDNSRKVILEENPDEYVQWGGNPNRIFLSEHIPQNNSTAIPGGMKLPVCQHSSSNSQSSCSPCSSSPLDAGAYLPMSPIESVSENRTRQPTNHRSYDSTNHSRESSIHDDGSEGYVPMAPLSADAGYVSMDQSAARQGDLSPGLSSCSITSGTPSTDCRYSEFHLDKVSSYLTPSDDDIIVVRQTRAYSTGSKPDAPQNKSIRWDSSEGMRARAFSVGSRCNSNKSSTPRRTPNSTSTSSIEPCDDLVEMDFSANKLRRRNLHQRYKQQTAAKMNNSLEKTLAYNGVPDGYMDMSPKSSPKLESINDSRVMSDVSLSPPRLSKHLIGRSPPLNMNFVKQSFAKNSPVTTSCLLEKVVETEFQSSKQNCDDSYMEMKPGVCDMLPTPPKAVPVIATATNLHARKDTCAVSDSTFMRTLNVPHIKQPLLETDGKQFKQSSTTVDGYLDMSFKGRRSENQSVSSVVKMTEKPPEGYVDMSFHKNSRKNLVDSNSCKKPTEIKSSPCCHGKENQVDTRQCSKPIAIQPGKNKRSPASNFFRRYKSEETQPTKPNFLPLGFNIPASFSLGRKKKVSQKKEKTGSPVEQGPVTTMFPLSPDHSCPSLGHDLNSEYMVMSSVENVRLSIDHHALERVDERANWDCRRDAAEADELDDEENAEYVAMTPGVMPILHRKISEPQCMKYAGKNESLAKETKESINKSLQRSTSVPSTMCGMRDNSSEEKNDVKCKSDSAMNCVPEHESPTEINQGVTCTTNLQIKLDDVPSTPNSNSCADTLREREKVMYASLEIPPSEEEVSKTLEESASSNKPSDQSNLTYAQIDFEKSSRSSSPSK